MKEERGEGPRKKNWERRWGENKGLSMRRCTVKGNRSHTRRQVRGGRWVRGVIKAG